MWGPPLTAKYLKMLVDSLEEGQLLTDQEPVGVKWKQGHMFLRDPWNKKQPQPGKYGPRWGRRAGRKCKNSCFNKNRYGITDGED